MHLQSGNYKYIYIILHYHYICEVKKNANIVMVEFLVTQLWVELFSVLDSGMSYV